MKRAVLVAVFLAAGVCTLSAQTPAPQPEGYPAAGAPAIVKVISAGAAPRAALRYTPAAGTKQHIDMTMSISMSMEMSGMSVPPMSVPAIKIGADCAVTEVAPSGDVTFTIAFNGAEADAGGNPQVASQLQSLTDELKSAKGTVTVSNRGVTRSSTFDAGRKASSPLGGSMASTTELMRMISVPLPEEEVGVGARWEVRNTVSNGGMTMYQKAEFELVAVEGRIVTMKSRSEQTAPRQALSNPAMPAGAEIVLESYAGTGSGNTRLNLNELVPTSDGALDNGLVMTVSMNGNAQQMAVNTSMKLTITPGK